MVFTVTWNRDFLHEIEVDLSPTFFLKTTKLRLFLSQMVQIEESDTFVSGTVGGITQMHRGRLYDVDRCGEVWCYELGYSTYSLT